MPVSVNPIRNDAEDRNVQILGAALGLARDIYKVNMDEKAAAKAAELASTRQKEQVSADDKKLAWQSAENEKDRSSKAALERERIAAQKDLKARELALKLPGGALGLPGKQTPGQKTLDTAFAKDFNEWETTGKSALMKNLSLLEGAVATLQKRENDTFGTSGRFTGNLPDFLRSEESISLREDVHRAAQGALKAALGTNFTEKEGERIMKAAYNETLSPTENIKRIKAAVNEIVQNANTMEERARYFEENGTLAGLKRSAQSAIADSGNNNDGSIVVPKGLQNKLGVDKIDQNAVAAEIEKRRKATAGR